MASQTPEATLRPWSHRPNHKPYHIVVFGGRKAYEAGLTTSDNRERDAALIVEAVNNYDRLRAIEAAARAMLDAANPVCCDCGVVGEHGPDDADCLTLPLRAALQEPSR